jgi:hypothetical protein
MTIIVSQGTIIVTIPHCETRINDRDAIRIA